MKGFWICFLCGGRIFEGASDLLWVDVFSQAPAHVGFSAHQGCFDKVITPTCRDDWSNFVSKPDKG
jgi:hypothetical protein